MAGVEIAVAIVCLVIGDNRNGMGSGEGTEGGRELEASQRRGVFSK